MIYFLYNYYSFVSHLIPSFEKKMSHLLPTLYNYLSTSLFICACVCALVCMPVERLNAFLVLVYNYIIFKFIFFRHGLEIPTVKD